MMGLEGFMYVYAARGVGMLITKPLQFFANFGVNYLKTASIAGFAPAQLGFQKFSLDKQKNRCQRHAPLIL